MGQRKRYEKNTETKFQAKLQANREPRHKQHSGTAMRSQRRRQKDLRNRYVYRIPSPVRSRTLSPSRPRSASRHSVILSAGGASRTRGTAEVEGPLTGWRHTILARSFRYGTQTGSPSLTTLVIRPPSRRAG